MSCITSCGLDDALVREAFKTLLSIRPRIGVKDGLQIDWIKSDFGLDSLYRADDERVSSL